MIPLLMSFASDGSDENDRFTELYIKYHEAVYYRAYQFVENDQDALDVMQETFISIARNFSKIGDIDSRETRSYVMAVAESKALSALAQRKKRQRTEEAVIREGDIMRQETKLTDEYSEAEIIEIVDSLPEKYRDTLCLYYLQGRSVKETAERLGTSGTATRKRLERARRMLKEMMGDE